MLLKRDFQYIFVTLKKKIVFKEILKDDDEIQLVEKREEIKIFYSCFFHNT